MLHGLCNLKEQRCQVVRVHQSKQGSVDVNLALSTQELLASVWNWYPGFMLDRRAAGLVDVGWAVTIAVIDGNAKLARRICGRAVGELLHCAVLGKYTAVQCSEKPCFKKARCQVHARRVEGDAAGPPQLEVVVAHRRRRALQSSPTAAPYDV